MAAQHLGGLLGEVVAAQHLGEAQAIPEEGAPAETLSANELASGDLRMADTTAHIDDLADDMASVNENSEASNETPKPDAQSKGSHPSSVSMWRCKRRKSWVLRTTPRASKPRTIQTPL